MKKYLVMILTFILMINLFIPTHVYAEDKIAMEATVFIGKSIPSGEAALTSTKDTIQYTIKFHYPKEGSYILGYRYKIRSLENPLYYESYRIKIDGKPAQFPSKELRENHIYVSFPYTDSTTYTQQYQDEITFINYLFIPPDY
ncbi:MAG: hypothetical protein IJ875_02025 [Solobacterium sp.]|nr:hypothetical protein [Solobacterium sp.]